MKQSTKEAMAIWVSTAVVITLMWLLPETWLKIFITAVAVVGAWIMCKMGE